MSMCVLVSKSVGRVETMSMYVLVSKSVGSVETTRHQHKLLTGIDLKIHPCVVCYIPYV